ncbi:hypothetical protein HanLR1_Chr16g0640641 [Helianthus annuus]|nr:hypothetical protein HanLR1_Chr16g0640641 [Helianthus annuus]
MQMDGPPSLTSVVVRPDSSFEDIEQPIEIHDDGVQAVSIGAMARVQRSQDQLTHTSSYNSNNQAPSMGLMVHGRGDSQPAGDYLSYNAPPSHTDVARRHHKSHEGESYPMI